MLNLPSVKLCHIDCFFPVVFILLPAIVLVLIAVAAGMGAYNRWEKKVYGTSEPEEDDSHSDSSDAYSFGNSWAKLAEELNHGNNY